MGTYFISGNLASEMWKVLEFPEVYNCISIKKCLNNLYHNSFSSFLGDSMHFKGFF